MIITRYDKLRCIFEGYLSHTTVNNVIGFVK